MGPTNIMSIYPTLPAHATKDYFEMFEPIDEWEFECKCKILDGEPEVCEPCKVYFNFDDKEVQNG